MTRRIGRARLQHLMSSLTCGLDVHSDWTDVTVRKNHDGKIVRSVRRLPNGRILEFLKENPDISRIAMEASTSAIPLYRKLEDAGYDDVLVSHPKKTRLIAESVIKTDRVDSEALSELARLNALPLAWIPDEETVRLREKVRRRAYLVRMRTRMKNKIRMHLLYEGIKDPGFGSVTYRVFGIGGALWQGRFQFLQDGCHTTTYQSNTVQDIVCTSSG